MENIIKAVERAKESPVRPQQRPELRPLPTTDSRSKEIKLSDAVLESNRIIAHDVTDPRSRSFDMLRTPVLQTMGSKSWQLLGITSPTPACGKTVVSINLALSIARQHERSVLLVDLDLRRPQVANTLGLKCRQGLMGVLEGQCSVSAAVIQTKVKNERLLVLPTEKQTLNSSEWMTSRAMSDILKEIRQEFANWTVILDLPPILTGDDVISILPQIDCVLFVAAAGTTTIQEIKECNKHLEATSIVRVVVNKAPDSAPAYYYAGELGSVVRANS